MRSGALAPVPALALIALLFAGVASASAQVAPDSSWMPAFSDPQYPEGEGPVVAIDAAHRNRHTRDGGFAPFARLLEEDGYRVRASAEPFTAEALEGIDVLVVANAIAAANVGNWSQPIEPALTPAEVAAVAAWVEGGGSLLLIADHMPFAGAAAPLAAAFGVEFLDGFAMDSARMGRAVFARARGELADHEPAQGRSAASRVDSVATFSGQAFRAPGATPLLLLPPGYGVLLPEVAWEFDESTPQVPGEGLLQGAVLERGSGRVAVFGEAAMFTAQIAGPARAPVGMNHPAAGGNARFSRNVLAWLVGAAGAPSAGRPADRVYRKQVEALGGAVYEFRGGLWFDGDSFRPRTFYTQDGMLVAERPARVDSLIDLRGLWVVPPFAEAHNHNLELGPDLEETIRRYLQAGVFYVKNPNVLPRSALAIRHLVNQPGSVDVSFAMGGFTGPGGHPIGVVERNLRRGIWTEAEGEGAFYHVLADTADLAAKWADFLATDPDFVKVYLLYSEEYAERRDDPGTRGWRGLDPEVLEPLVRRAHEAGLRVTAHVETAADFEAAVAAGVDEIGHLPGFRGNEERRFPHPEIFLLDEEQARSAAEHGVTVVTTLPAFGDSGPAREVFRHNLSLLRRSGVPIAIGSDAYETVGVEQADRLLDLGVFSPLEVLKAWVETTPATIFPGRRIGRLADGYEASFLVLEGDPLDEFAMTQRIRLRLKQGRILDPVAGSLGVSGGPATTSP